MKEFRVTKCLVNSLIGEYAIFADKCKKSTMRIISVCANETGWCMESILK